TARGATLEDIVGEPYLAVTGIFLAVVWEAIGHLYSARGDVVRARCSESLASFSAAIGYAGSLAVLPRAANLGWTCVTRLAAILVVQAVALARLAPQAPEIGRALCTGPLLLWAFLW